MHDLSLLVEHRSSDPAMASCSWLGNALTLIAQGLGHLEWNDSSRLTSVTTWLRSVYSVALKAMADAIKLQLIAL
jgi:hypothetical protein